MVRLRICWVATIDGLGPIGGFSHSEDEYLEIPSLVERTLLLAEVIQKLSNKITTPINLLIVYLSYTDVCYILKRRNNFIGVEKNVAPIFTK